MTNLELDNLLNKVLLIIEETIPVEATERIIDLFAIAQQRNAVGFKVDDLNKLQPKKITMEF